MKKCKFFSIILTFFILFSLFLVSCDTVEIGLGSSVDTKAPELTIENPPSGSIIRDVFAIRGSFSDDGTIESITVELKQTENADKSYKRKGIIDQKEGIWWCEIDPFDEEDPIFDGQYEAVVTIKDTAKRETIRSRPYTIDNTAPVLALTRPASIIPAGSNTQDFEESSDFDSFGQDFVIEGHVADTCERRFISVDVYDLNGELKYSTLNAAEEDSKRLKIDSDFSTTIASYKSPDYTKIHGETEANKAYKAIYGEGDSAGTQKFFCEITVYDNAKKYPLDGTEPSGENLVGNKVNHFYLYEGDLYNSIFDSYGMTNAYRLLNGSFSDDDSRTLTTSLSPEDAKNDLKNTAYQETRGFLSLNPKNNPYFKVSGHEPLDPQEMENGTVFDDTEHHITNNSTIVVEVYPGLDQTPLKQESIGLYLLRADYYGNPVDSEGNVIEEDEVEEKAEKIWLIRPQVNKEGENIISDEEIAERNSMISKIGSTYKLTYYLTTKSPTVENKNLESGQRYLFGIQGRDKKDVDVSNAGSVLGFMLVESGGAPSITILSVSPKWVTTNANTAEQPELVVENAVKEISVSMSFAGDAPFKLSRIVGDKDDGEILSNYAFNEYIDTIIPPPESGTIKYTLSGNNNLSNTNEVNFYVDNERPVVVDFSVPSVYETARNSYKFTVEVSDGDASLSSKVADVNMRLSCKDPADNTKMIVSDWVSVGSSDTWEETVVFQENEFLKDIFASEGEKKIEVRAIDTAGNISEIKEKTFIYDISLPKLTVQNYQMEGSPALQIENEFYVSKEFSISGIAEDSYGIKSIAIKQTTGQGENQKILEIPVEIGTDGKWIVENLPRNTEDGKTDEANVVTGDYSYKITVTDLTGIKKESSSDYKVIIDLEPPFVNITSPENNMDPVLFKNKEKALDGKNFRFTGTMNDGNGKGITGYSYKFVKAGENEAEVDWINVNTTAKTWSFYNELGTGTEKQSSSSLEEGVWTLFVKAIDEAGNESANAERKFVIDQGNPSLTAAITGSENCIQNNSVWYYKDVLSGTISYSDTFGMDQSSSYPYTFKYGDYDISPAIVIENGNWQIDSSLFANCPDFGQGFDFAGLTNSVQTLSITVYDKVGKSDEKTFRVCKDNNPPVVTALPVTNAALSYQKSVNYTFSGTAKDANLEEVTAVLYKNGIATNEEGSLSPSGENGNWEWKVYNLEEATYNIKVTAKDKANNKTDYVTGSIVVDTTAPRSTINGSGLYQDDGLTAATSLTNGTDIELDRYYAQAEYSLSGSVIDSNFEYSPQSVVLKENGIEKTVTFAGSGTAEDPYIWTYTPASFADGTYSYTITITDKAENKTIYSLSVVYDTTAPELTITSPVNNSAYGNMPAANGKASDAGIGIKSVKWSTNDSENDSDWTATDWTTVTDWSANLGTMENEGFVTLYVKATDNFGRTTRKNVSFSYDLYNPEVVETDSVTEYQKKGYNFTLTGTAGDTNAIDCITISEGAVIYGSTNASDSTASARITSENAAVTLSELSASTALTAESGKGKEWTITFSDQEQTNPQSPLTLAEGSHKFSIIAKDSSGKVSTEIIKNIFIDTIAPEVLPVNTPNTLQTANASFRFEGTTKDNLNGTTDSRVKNVKVMFKSYNSDSEDAAVTASTEWLDANGDTSWNFLAVFTDDSVDEVFGNNEGYKTISVKAFDYAGNESAILESPKFLYDRNIPNISLITYTIGSESSVSLSTTDNFFAKESFKLNITAQDGYLVKKIVVKQKKDDVTKIIYSLDNINSTTKTQAVENLPRNVSEIAADEEDATATGALTLDENSSGEYEYIIEVTDAAGKRASEARIRAKIDKKAPTVTLTTDLDAAYYQGNSKTFTFNAEDPLAGDGSTGSGLSKYYYKFDNNNQTTGWVEKSASTSFEIIPSLISGNTLGVNGELNEGKWDLWYYVKDNAGNESEHLKAEFWLDQNAPSLVVNNLIEGKTNPVDEEVTDSGYTISGTVSDSNAIAAANAVTNGVITIKVEGEVAASISSSALTGSNSNEWTYTIPKASIHENGLTEIEVIAKDIVGKTSSKNYNLYYDTQAPELEITAPVSEEQVERASKIIKGTVRDEGYGLASLQFVLKVKNDEGNFVIVKDSEDRDISGYWTVTDTGSVSGGNYPISIKGEQWYYAGGSNTAIAIPLGTNEGTLKLEVTATEKVTGNHTAKVNPQTVTFFYDAAEPEISESGAASRITNTNFVLTGTAYDTNQLAKIEIKQGNTLKATTEANPGAGVKTITFKASSAEDAASVTLASAKSDSTKGTWAAAFTFLSNPEDSDTNTYDFTQDGEYRFNIIATDISGKQTTVQRTIQLDGTAPVITSNVPTTSKKEIGPENNKKDWYNTRSIEISVQATDTNGSGVSSAEYSVDGPTAASRSWTNIPNNGESFVGTITFQNDGANTYYLRVKDIAGNYVYDNNGKIVYIDSTVPASAAISSVDSIEAGSGENQFGGTKLTNGSTNISFTMTASDAGELGTNATGIASVTIVKVGTNQLTTSNQITVNGTSNEAGLWSGSASIQASVINSSGGVVAKVTDNVDNSYDFTLFQIQYDDKYPRVTMSTIDDADKTDTGENAKTQINGRTIINGTASDDQILASVKLQYSKKTGETTWSDWEDTGLSNQGTIYSWSFKVDTTQSPYTDGDNVRFRVLAKDAAGNEGNSGNTTAISENNFKEVVISQDSDRPVIRISNLQMSNPVDTNYYWHRYDTMYGTVTDDDGTVTSVKYKVHTAYVLSEEPTNWVDEDNDENSLYKTYYSDAACTTPATSTFAAGTYYKKSAWSNNIYSDGMWEISSLIDGQNLLYFQIEDAEERESEKLFTSNTASTSPATFGPKIQDSVGDAKLGYSNSADDTLKVKVDTAAPEIISEKYYLSSSASYNSSFNWESANNIGLLSTTKCGGKENFLYVRVEARDSNGIDTSKTTMKFKDTLATTTADGDSPNPVLQIDQPASGTSVITVIRIDLSQFTSGTNNFVVDLYDNAGKSIKDTKSILIDNTPPELAVSNYTAGVVLYGSNNNSLRLYQNTDSDISKFYFYVTNNSNYSPTYNAQSNTYTGFTEMSGLQVGTTTTVFFDGGTTSSVEYHAPKFYNIIQTLTGRTDQQMLLNDDPVSLWFWYYAVDDLGNASVPSAETRFAFSVFPNGDKPRIDITYPASKQSEQDAPVSVGGTIRVTGYTEISTDTVDAVFVQIDPDYTYVDSDDLDGSAFNNAGWKGALEDAINGKGVSYTIVDLSSETFYGSDIPENSPYRYAIKVSGTTNWNFNLNSRKEVNTNGNYVAIKAFAVSTTNHKISEAVTHVVKIDAHAPLIGNTKPLELVQYDDEDHVVARQVYSTDMYLKGNWFLEGSIEHGSGIKNATWTYYYRDGNTWEEATDTIVDNGTGTEGKVFENDIPTSETTYKNYYFKLPVGYDGNDCGTLSYVLTITDGRDSGEQTVEEVVRINYDNRPPVLNLTSSSSDTSIVLEENEEENHVSNTITQSNGTFTIEGNVNESGTGQSGFNRVAMFFTREVGNSNTVNVIDPMLDNESNNGRGNYEAVTGLTYKPVAQGGDGIYWRPAEGTLANNEIVLSSIGGTGIDSVENFAKIIRNGGLCKINDVIYRIANVNVSTKKITVEGPIDDITETTPMYFAVGALIIDHKSTEGGTAYTDALGNTQYHTTATYNTAGPVDELDNLRLIDDDGDQMIESATRNGTAYNWSASINSSNIHDGIVTAHFVAFDNAGNVSHKTFKAIVSNNAPRIAGLVYGTDSNGNGEFDESEKINTYHLFYTPSKNLQNKGNGFDISRKNNSCVIGDNSTALVVKGDLIVQPEIVGGNDGLGYRYEYKTAANDATYRSEFIDYNVGYANDTDIRNDDLTITIPLSDFLNPAHKVKEDEAQAMKFEVWDKTEGTTPGETSGKAEITLWTKVYLSDEDNPENVIKRFYWTDNTDNSVYFEDGIAKGHIELEDDWINASGYDDEATNGEYDSDPKVSGIITIQGIAKDETCVEKLSIYIPGINNGEQIIFAKRDRNENSNNRGNFIDCSEVEGVSFFEDDVEDVFNSATGTNTVKWKIKVDTSKISTIAATDVKIRAGALDRGSPSLSNGNVVYPENGNLFEPEITIGSTGRGTESSAHTALYKVDIVPYISKVETKLSESLKSSIRNAYSRTALGHYIVSLYPNAEENETILIEGFNLGTSTNQPIYNGNNLSVNAAGKVQLPVTDIETSGPLVLKVNNIETLNNKNNNNACGSYKTATTQITETSSYTLKSKYAYNRMPNGTSNNLLTDDVVFDVWELYSDAAKPMSGELREPSLKINPVTGQVGLAFVSGPADISIADTDNNYSYKRWQNNYATFSNISFAYDDKGYAHATATGLDTNPKDKHAGRFSYFYNKWGPSGLDYTGNYYGAKAVRLESLAVPKKTKEKEETNSTFTYANYLNGVTQYYQIDREILPVKGEVIDNDYLTETRFYSPSLATTVHGDETSIYLAYYDSVQGQIRFRYNKDVPQEWSADNTYEKYIVNDDGSITEDPDYPAEYLTGTKLGTNADGSFKDEGKFVNLHHGKNDSDDFVDNLGYFIKASDCEAYMEANTDHFSLIAGEDYQQGDDVVDIVPGSVQNKSVVITDAEGTIPTTTTETDSVIKSYDFNSNPYIQWFYHKSKGTLPEGYEKRPLFVRNANSEIKANDTVYIKVYNDIVGYYVVESCQKVNTGFVNEYIMTLKDMTSEQVDTLVKEIVKTVISSVEGAAFTEEDDYEERYFADIISEQDSNASYFGSDTFRDNTKKKALQDNIKIVKYKKTVTTTQVKEYTNVPAYKGIRHKSGYDTGVTGYKYVAIDAKKGDSAAEDIVVAVWYDGTGLNYAYTDNPTNGMDNNIANNNLDEGGKGWKGNKVIFSEGGEYCTVKFDPNGGVHIAAYGDGSLKYAYLPNHSADYNEATDSVTIDSYTITGERLNLDVGLVDYEKTDGTIVTVAVPYITYYNGTARMPTVAKLVIPQNGVMDYKAQGVITVDGSDVFTGNWEISLVPTSSKLTSQYYDKMNIGLWKQNGKIVNSTNSNFTVTGAGNGVTSNSNSSTTTNGNIYGNGTANPILGYAVESTAGTYFETAQKK